jgi:carbamoyltransferase
MYILGINPALNASVVVLHDNRVAFAAQEERYTRVKNEAGFPRHALQGALDYLRLSVNDIDLVCVGGLDSKIPTDRWNHYRKYTWRFEQIRKKWCGPRYTLHDLMVASKACIKRYLAPNVQPDILGSCLKKSGLAHTAVCFDHHTCHAAAAYYGLARDYDDQYLVFSMDGGGDGRTSAVFIGRQGRLDEIAASNSFSPACLYGYITYLMGFIPHEHEYKLMGMAPHARREYAVEVKEKLSTFLGFDARNPLVLNNTERYPDLTNSRGNQRIKSRLEEDLFRTILGMRFDTMAGGLQLLSEEMAIQWIRAGVQQTGIRKVLLTGGFFMNVKANQLLAELPEVERIDCFPSCGDETNAFGAAFLGYMQQAGKDGLPVQFNDFCLGPDPMADLAAACDLYKDRIAIRRSHNIHDEVSDLLIEGKIVARCSGRMEFGARALGNRSILARPDRLELIAKINNAIKKRDFWMPFAPAVLHDYAETLITLPPSIPNKSSPYMMFTFSVRPEKCSSIMATVHQADMTARAQVVEAGLYPEFYRLIERFYQKTGIPAVLNTSFNLHGYPIVLGAREAIDVYLNSELDVLVVEDHVITRTKG